MKFYDMVSKTDIYLANAKKQYKIWRKSYRCCTKKYSNHVTKIIDIFDLKGKNQFDKKLAPKFWAGDIANRKPRFIIVSLNPGLPKKQKMSSRDIDARSWNAYMEKRRNWFTNPNFKTSDYWQKNSKLICGINKQPEKEMDGEYTLKNVLNLNLFPYHSNKSEDFPSRFTIKQLEEILHHLVLLFDLIEEKKPKYCFFNGKVWKTLLIDHKLINIKFSDPKKYKKNSRGTKFSMYFGKKENTRYVLFDKFLSSTHYYRVNDNDFRSGIPNFIKKHH